MIKSLKYWQLILKEDKVLCWSASLQLGFFSHLHPWGLGDSFKPKGKLPLTSVDWSSWHCSRARRQWENVCGSPDPQPGCQGGKLERQVGCLVSLSHSIECELGSTALLGALVLWAWGSWRKGWRREGWACPRAEKYFGFGSGLG